VKLLLDTCTFLWIVFDDRQALTARVIELYQSVENDLYLSSASALEIAIKYSSKRLVLAEAPDRFVPRQREAHRVHPLPIDEESACRAGQLPWLHRDPFDRILIGQAIVHGLTLVTPDTVIAKYHVRTIW